ncbi:VG15 protein [Bifidobacterium vansinderenii]|nr:hypothetical protein [Bifidobacterium vansinderenii]
MRGLTYTQVKNGRARSGVTLADLWPDLSNVDDAQQFIADMIATSGRMTMRANIAKDPTKPRWARVCGGVKPCAFCVMLASRGFAYSSEDTASLGGSFHDGHCHCTVVPSWGASTQLLEKQSEWKSMYSQAMQSAKDSGDGTGLKVITSWLRYLNPDKLSDGSAFQPDMRIPRGCRLEQQLGASYTKKINELLRDTTHKSAARLWAKYADRFEIKDGQYQGIAEYNPSKGGIYIDIDTAMSGDNVRREGQNLFHESGHMLDWILGRNGYRSAEPVGGGCLPMLLTRMPTPFFVVHRPYLWSRAGMRQGPRFLTQ